MGQKFVFESEIHSEFVTMLEHAVKMFFSFSKKAPKIALVKPPFGFDDGRHEGLNHYLFCEGERNIVLGKT